tara:strand:- start:637 stop:834 length:198 start_codon:yes stop_codon:yes gene_type:complete
METSFGDIGDFSVVLKPEESKEVASANLVIRYTCGVCGIFLETSNVDRFSIITCSHGHDNRVGSL